MSIPRSKSAPRFGSQDPSSASALEDYNHKIRGSASGATSPTATFRHARNRRQRRARRGTNLSSDASQSTPALSPLVTPRLEREDPFNLGGFFPSHVGDVVEEEDWNWLRNEEGGEWDVREGRPSMFSPVEEGDRAAPSSSMELNGVARLQKDGGEKDADEVIEKEDKFGVLSLRNLFSGSFVPSGLDNGLMESSAANDDLSSEDGLTKPYSYDDSPVDDDALHGTLRTLRRDHCRATALEDKASFGELFLLPDSATKATPVDDGWRSSLYQGVRMLWE